MSTSEAVTPRCHRTGVASLNHVPVVVSTLLASEVHAAAQQHWQQFVAVLHVLTQVTSVTAALSTQCYDVFSPRVLVKV